MVELSKKAMSVTNYVGELHGKNWHFGNVINPETGKTEDVTIPVLSALDPKTLLIGGGLILLGAGYICIMSYKNGAEAYMNAEVDALKKAGLYN
jgi:hypothetical protein